MSFSAHCFIHLLIYWELLLVFRTSIFPAFYLTVLVFHCSHNYLVSAILMNFGVVSNFSLFQTMLQLAPLCI